MSLARVVFIITLLAAIGGCGKTETASTVPSVPSIASTPPAVSREPALNAAPLGLEIGYANIAGVKAKIGALTKLEDRGTNSYSGGPMFASDGTGVGIDGLSSLVLVFDKAGLLSGIIMTLPKAPKDVLEKMSGKYTVVDNRIDTFMGNGYARLEKGDSLIEIDAPHLNFSMEVRYLTKQLMADVQRQRAEAEATKRQEQTNKL